jgi:hypothetical protein
MNEEITALTSDISEELKALHAGLHKELVETHERNKLMREYSRNMMTQGVRATSGSSTVQETSEPAPSEPAPSEQENPEI